MGYTHYWRRREKLEKVAFENFARDFKLLLPPLEAMGVILAGGNGEGEPVVSAKEVIFNGVAKCGHEEKDLGITWPSDKAGGVGDAVVDGTWFAGAQLQTRSCSGDCSHETFYLPRYHKMPDYQNEKGNKLVFDFCKTAYKPYDVAVTAALIIAKHHFGDSIIISSDGENKDWFDGALLCKTVLGYGFDFKLKTDSE